MGDLDLSERQLKKVYEGLVLTFSTLIIILLGTRWVSGVTVLSESHISIHTWPERNFASLDIFMCGHCDPQNALDYLQKILNPSSVDQSLNHRGVIPAVARMYK